MSAAIINAVPDGWFVTYKIVTPESAEQGDCAERGFVSPGEWHHSDRPDSLTLREALELCNPGENSGRWFSECDGRQDYGDGSEERRDLHPPRKISPASYARVCKLLKIRP